jgi:glycosyltransferase involved in cell wall biosynthesis
VLIDTDARVTIVIPTYRRHGMLRETIASVLAQTVEDLVVVVSIDGDDEEAVAVAREPGDSRVRPLWDGAQRGETQNTVRGITATRTPFFAIVHDDDTWEPTLLERLLGELEADPSAALAFADHHVMDAEGTIDPEGSVRHSAAYGRDRLPAGRHQPLYRVGLVQQSIPAVCATVYRRDAVDLEDVPPELSANVDYWLTWLAAKGGSAGVYVPERLARWRLHGAQGTQQLQPRWIESAVVMYERLVREPELDSVREEMRDRLASAYRRLAMLRIQRGERGGRALALKSMRTRPTLRGGAVAALALAPAPVARAAMARQARA